MTITTTRQLSDKLDDLANKLAARIGDAQFLNLPRNEVLDLMMVLKRRTADARTLEKMLERRLKAGALPSALPGAAAPVPPVTVALPPEANDSGTGKLVQFRPRPGSGARIIPIGSSPQGAA